MLQIHRKLTKDGKYEEFSFQIPKKIFFSLKVGQKKENYILKKSKNICIYFFCIFFLNQKNAIFFI